MYFFITMMFKVNEHWVTYTEKVDHMVENALRSNIKCSMKMLSRAINGDSKTSPNPVFKVLVALRKATPQTTPKVPSMPFYPIRSCNGDLFIQIIRSMHKNTHLCLDRLSFPQRLESLPRLSTYYLSSSALSQNLNGCLTFSSANDHRGIPYTST